MQVLVGGMPANAEVLDRGVAVAAVDAVAGDVALVAERHRLRPSDACIGDIRRALEIYACPESKGERKYPDVDRGPGNYVSAAMENLHRSGFFLQRNLHNDPSLEFKNLQPVFWKLAIIAAHRICKMIFHVRTKKNSRDETNSVCGLPEIHYQQLRFGHFFDRIPQAFASQARIFHSSIRHVVNAERRHISGDDAANFQLLIGLKNHDSHPG